MDNQIGNSCSILPIIFRCCDNGELAFKTLKARSSRCTKGFMLIPFCDSCSLLHIDGRNQHWEGTFSTRILLTNVEIHYWNSSSWGLRMFGPSSRLDITAFSGNFELIHPCCHSKWHRTPDAIHEAGEARWRGWGPLAKSPWHSAYMTLQRGLQILPV